MANPKPIAKWSRAPPHLSGGQWVEYKADFFFIIISNFQLFYFFFDFQPTVVKLGTFPISLKIFKAPLVWNTFFSLFQSNTVAIFADLSVLCIKYACMKAHRLKRRVQISYSPRREIEWLSILLQLTEYVHYCQVGYRFSN